MDTQKLKTILYIIAIFLVVMLYMRWQAAHTPPAKPVVHHENISAQAITANQVPHFGHAAQAVPAHTSLVKTAQSSARYINVDTPLLHLKIDLTGGKIVEAQLLKYPKKLHSKTPFTLLSNAKGQHYFAETGFASHQLPAPTTLIFHTARSHYQMGKQGSLTVNLHWQGRNGVTVEKIFHFNSNSYAVDVSEKIMNGSTQAIHGRFYGQLVRQPVAVKHSFFLGNYYTYTGAVVSSHEDHYQKVSFGDMKEKDTNIHTQGGWVAMVQHYFISAVIPVGHQQNQLYSRKYEDNYGIGLAYPEASIAAGHSYQAQTKLYVGPAIAHTLNQLAPYLGKTVDYGWLWFISDIIFAVMAWIYSLIGNWGWSIVLVTILIKLIFYPLSAKSYRSMGKMRQLAPKIKQLKERFGDDRQAMGRATMELYRKEKVNPLGGCLPMVIQIPVFFALYWVLIESVELRQAPFIFWIHDLSVRDPYFILPILMGIAMFVQQRLNPAPADPTQAKVMMFLPIMFTVMFAFFPSGLVLYWLVNTLFSLAQQWWVMRKIKLQAATTARQKR